MPLPGRQSRPSVTYLLDHPAEKECPHCGSVLFVKKKKHEGETLFCLREGCGYRIDILDQ